MNPDPVVRRIVLTHAGREGFTDMTRTILAKLGYPILSPEDFAHRCEHSGFVEPALRIVDERQLADVPEDAWPALPIVVLSGRPRRRPRRPRRDRVAEAARCRKPGPTRAREQRATGRSSASRGT